MDLNKKSLLIGASCYAMWGILPIYWHALNGVDSIFILCNRIIWSAVFCIILLGARGKLKLLAETFKNKQHMKYLIPAAVFITLNWGLYIWCMGSAHVLDSSFGYYIEPLVVSLFGVVVFRERCTKLQLAAFAFALAGVVYYAVRLGTLPMLSLGIAMTFAVYGALKKKVNIDATVSICAETIIVAPLAIAYVIWSLATGRTGEPIDLTNGVLLVLAGPITAAPLILFAVGVNNLPLITMGFLQYISPTFQMALGLVFGEVLSKDQILSFIFIWIGFIIFTVSLAKQSKKQIV